MTEKEKLKHSLNILLEHRHTTFKTVYGEYNINIRKLIEELDDN